MVTIRDISKACHVSPATVSKALNGYPDIGAATAERIRAKARELHYMPNAAARQLKTNASHNIGIVFEDGAESGLTHEFFSMILNSAKTEIEKLGYDITFVSSRVGGNSFLEHCRYRKVDGVLIACVNFQTKQIRDLMNSEFPVVTIDYSYDNHSCVMSALPVQQGSSENRLYTWRRHTGDKTPADGFLQGVQGTRTADPDSVCGDRSVSRSVCSEAPDRGPDAN